MVEKLLLASPDVPTLWNYRREMLLSREAKADGDLDADETRAELALTQKCLMKQPKSYAAWHHRLWIVRRRPALAKDELALAPSSLKLDERNSLRGTIGGWWLKWRASPSRRRAFAGSTPVISTTTARRTRWRKTLPPSMVRGGS